MFSYWRIDRHGFPRLFIEMRNHFEAISSICIFQTRFVLRKKIEKKSSANQRLFNVPITESNEVYCTAILNIKN